MDESCFILIAILIMKLDFQKERDRDLFSAYERVLKQLGREACFKSRLEILVMAVNSPAKQFYVSTEEASRRVSQMINGRDTGIRSVYRRKMYEEITKRFLELRSRFPNIGLRQGVEEVIYQPAPSFYLNPSSAKVIFHHIFRKKRCHLL